MPRIVALLALIWLAGLPAHASPQICERAGIRAAAATGVPPEVLRAISLTETGRVRNGQLQPWPWTVNMEGAGKWFDSRAEAQAYVDRHHDRGARSYDVGCFQINYRWHGQAFASNADMFDPDKNALYAARFLSELYRETGSWSKSAGAYHSRTPKFANRYSERFDRILARITGGALPPAPPEPLAPEPGPDGAPVTVVAVAPLAIDGPLTISPPARGRGGSLAVLGTLPGAAPLLSAPRGPLY